MNSTIIDIPPRTVRPATRPPYPKATAFGNGGEDDLRRLAADVVRHDPVLALLLARSGNRLRQQ